MCTVSRPLEKQGGAIRPNKDFHPQAMSRIDVITNRIIALISPPPPADERILSPSPAPSIPNRFHPRPWRSKPPPPPRRKNSPRKLVLEFFVPLSRLSVVESSGSRDQVQSIVIGFHRKLQGSRRAEVEAAAYLVLPLAAKKRGKKEGGSAG